jgi:MoaA/NifB/PqqE/SkfB family radical SAM enzyme
MNLTGLHLLLTYQCTFECDHCFVWGSPWQEGTMTQADIRFYLQQARDTDTITSIYFEGGEPFLYYPTLCYGVKLAHDMGFTVGVVTNGYWATSLEDATTWLKPFAGLIADLSVSSDLFHYSEELSQQAKNARQAAEDLGIPLGFISVAQPETSGSPTNLGQLTAEAGVMYRGRAARKLVNKAKLQPWEQFDQCPHEDLINPGRVHLDPLGYVHICQGISLGNLHQTTLKQICQTYNPQRHSINGPLLLGGPANLTRHYGIRPETKYADACHLCYTTRLELRNQFPDILAPDQVYGVGL